MYGLSNKQKLDFIKKYSEELGVTSYEFAQHTIMSDLGARNILNGVSKNPRTKNLNAMLEYLQDKVRGSALDEPLEEVLNGVSEPLSKEKLSLEDIIYTKIYRKLNPELEYIQHEIEELKKEQNNLNDKYLQILNKVKN